MSLLGCAVLIVGDEEFLRSRERDRLITAARAEVPQEVEVTVTYVAGETLTGADAVQALAVDLFGAVPVVVVTDAQKTPAPAVQALADWCRASTNDGVLVAEIAKAGDSAAVRAALKTFKDAGASVREVTAPKASERRRFAAAELARVGLVADGDADRVLADSEADLRGMAVRAEQLAEDLGVAEATTRVHVTADQVAAVASSAASVSGFLVADALAARDARAVARTLTAARQTGTPNILIVTACVTALRDIAAVRTGRTSKMPPWKAQKAQRNARRWSDRSLAAAIAHIGGAHPAVGTSGRRDSDLTAALLTAVTA